MPDHLDLQTFESLLKTEIIGKPRAKETTGSQLWRCEIWQSIESTNTRTIELAKAGAPEGMVVAARQQTAGRGRLGRVWVSPKDSGIYVSFLLKPTVPLIKIPLMSLAAGVSVAKTIESVAGFKPGLKWVNDIVYGGKKLGGILAEIHASGATTSESPVLIVGIGINKCFAPDAFPAEIKTSAICLEDITKSPLDANLLLATLAQELEQQYRILLQGERTQIINDWLHYSVTIGANLIATTGDKKYQGKAVGLGLDGELQLELADGSIVSLHSGEVTIRNADGGYS